VNVLNKQLWLADKLWSSSKWVECGVTASQCKVLCHERDAVQNIRLGWIVENSVTCYRDQH
jgi:hypothetical protein